MPRAGRRRGVAPSTSAPKRARTSRRHNVCSTSKASPPHSGLERLSYKNARSVSSGLSGSSKNRCAGNGGRFCALAQQFVAFYWPPVGYFEAGLTELSRFLPRKIDCRKSYSKRGISPARLVRPATAAAPLRALRRSALQNGLPFLVALAGRVARCNGEGGSSLFPNRPQNPRELARIRSCLRCRHAVGEVEHDPRFSRRQLKSCWRR